MRYGWIKTQEDIKEEIKNDDLEQNEQERNDNENKNKVSY